MEILTKNKKSKEYLRPTLVQVFLDADLRGSHNHLIELAKSKKLNLLELQANEAVLFINKKKTLMKTFVKGNTFAFTRRERIDLEAIQYLPYAFGADKGFNYDDALGLSLKERLKREPRRLGKTIPESKGSGGATRRKLADSRLRSAL